MLFLFYFFLTKIPFPLISLTRSNRSRNAKKRVVVEQERPVRVHPRHCHKHKQEEAFSRSLQGFARNRWLRECEMKWRTRDQGVKGRVSPARRGFRDRWCSLCLRHRLWRPFASAPTPTPAPAAPPLAPPLPSPQVHSRRRLPSRPPSPADALGAASSSWSASTISASSLPLVRPPLRAARAVGSTWSLFFSVNPGVAAAADEEEPGNLVRPHRWRRRGRDRMVSQPNPRRRRSSPKLRDTAN